MPTFAAIDIGSNSVRLSIGELKSGRIRVVHQDREVTRLGESVFHNGSLAPEAMERTLKVLRRFRKAVEKSGAEYTRAVATSAVRDAKNSRVFSDLVRSATGWKLRVITGLEEGRLIHLGVVSTTRTGNRPLLLIDLGGGSCELTLSIKGHIQHMVSLPLGAVRLTQEFLRHDPPTEKEMVRLNGFIEEEIQRVAGSFSTRVQTVIATSGTADALVAASSNQREERASRQEVVRLATQLSKLNRVQRERMPGINAKRSEIIVAGAAVYAQIMSRLGLRNFKYSPLGLRDGILAQMAADHDAGSRTHKQVESDRRDALLEMCRRYKVDMINSRQNEKLAGTLFEQLKKLHNLPNEYRDWISAAAMLQEVGSYINRTGRHRHAFYVIAHSELFGYTPEQRRLIAVIARYQGGSTPQPNDRMMRQMEPAQRDAASKAIAILRVARALNHGRRSAVPSVKARFKAGNVNLHLKKIKAGAELEAWATEKENTYFREVFGRNLFIVNP